MIRPCTDQVFVALLGFTLSFSHYILTHTQLLAISLLAVSLFDTWSGIVKRRKSLTSSVSEDSTFSALR